MRDEVEYIRAFLVALKKSKIDEGVETMSQGPKVNMVKLSGIIKKIMTEEKRGFCLVDPETEGSRFIACTVFDSPELSKRLATFKEDDYIQISGMIRAWSKKLEGGGYENRTEVRITAINNTGTAKNGAKKSAVQEDEMPW